MEKDIAIVGGGIAGLAIALGLQNYGIKCRVYESAPIMKPVGAGISLAFNAIKACVKLKIDRKIKESGKSIEKAWITNSTGDILSTMDYKKHINLFKEVSVVIHRHDLQHVLVNELKDDIVFTGKRVNGYRNLNNKTEILFQNGEKVSADFVVASDGINSIFRQTLLPDSLPRYSGYTCWRGVGELPDKYPYKDVVIESWGKGLRLGLVPLKNNQVYWFGVKNAPENDPGMKKVTKDDLLGLFKGWNENYLNVLRHTPDSNIILNDIADIAPLKKFAFDNILLTGDAAHATTPNIGQGGCQALEDAVVLSDLMAEYRHDYTVAFKKFETQRIARTAKVINTSRRIGVIAQFENPLLVTLRNFALKVTPETATINQVKWLTKTPF